MWSGGPSGVPLTVALPIVRTFGTARHSDPPSFSGTPGVASKVLTGQVPILTISYLFTPAVASKVLTGQVPVLTIAFKFVPTASSLVKSGQVPTLSIGYRFTPAVAGLSKAGQVPLLNIGWQGTPGLASLLKTGFAPTLTQTGATGAGGWDYKSKRRVIIGAKAYLVANADELNYLLLRELASDAPIVEKPVHRAKPVTVPRVISLGPVVPAKLETLTQQAEQLQQFDVLAELHRIRILLDDQDVMDALLVFRMTLH